MEGNVELGRLQRTTEVSALRELNRETMALNHWREKKPSDTRAYAQFLAHFLNVFHAAMIVQMAATGWVSAAAGIPAAIGSKRSGRYVFRNQSTKTGC
ncbi:hypothetical protein OKW34_003358 [Paraburkholderia youngii]|uniref:hypothetical protein n=1 Tax=Paraburkholderia youngii TaxID=2782701 RepID=UPI003D259B72